MLIIKNFLGNIFLVVRVISMAGMPGNRTQLSNIIGDNGFEGREVHQLPIHSLNS